MLAAPNLAPIMVQRAGSGHRYWDDPTATASSDEARFTCVDCSSVAYGDGDFIQAMTTPYGTTTFRHEPTFANRRIEATDPAGGTERVEYHVTHPGWPTTVRSKGALCFTRRPRASPTKCERAPGVGWDLNRRNLRNLRTKRIWWYFEWMTGAE